MAYGARAKEYQMKRSAVIRMLTMVMAVAVAVCLPVMAQSSGADPSGQTSSGQSSTATQSQASQTGQSSEMGGMHHGRQAGMAAMSGKQLLQHLAMANQSEIDMAQLAEQKSNNQQVKDFARTLQQDHSKAQDVVQQFAQKENVSVAAPSADQKSSKEAAMKQKMESLSGAEFDKEFIKHQVMDHQREVAQLQRISQSSSDPNSKQLADQLLPDMQKHLQTAQQLAQQLGVSVSSSGMASAKHHHNSKS